MNAFDRLRIAAGVLMGRTKDPTWFNPSFLRHVPEHFSPVYARKLPAVKAAVAAISWRVAALPLTAYAVDSGGDETAIVDDETNLVTKRWSAFATRIDGCQRMLASALLHGHGAVYVVRRSPNGPPESFQPLDPTLIGRFRMDGEVVYRYAGGGSLVPKIVPRDDLFWLPFEPPQDGVTDQSPLREPWPSIRSALAATFWMSGYYDRGATPTTVYSREDGAPSGKLLDENEALWENEDAMRRHQRRSMTLPPKWQPHQLGGNASDANAENAVNVGVQEVARIYDIPPLMLQDLSRGTYSNFAQARQGLAETLELWAARLAAEISNVLWPGGSRVVRFDTSLAMREPFALRMQGYRTGIEGRVLTPNEARVMEGLPVSEQEGSDDLQLAQPAIMVATVPPEEAPPQEEEEEEVDE